MGYLERLDTRPESFTYHRKTGGIYSTEKTGKLFPAKPPTEIPYPIQSIGQGFCHPSETVVTDQMSVSVIVQLEVIDIDHYHCQGLTGAERPSPILIESFVKSPPVGYAGQPVKDGHFFKGVVLALEFQLGSDARPDDGLLEWLADVVNRPQIQSMCLVLLVG
jgi:hypothetical protein